MSPRSRLLRGLTLLVAISGAAAADAQLASKSTGGTLDFQVISGAGFDRGRSLPVEFLWYPELDPDDTGYRLAAECSRRDRLSGPPGGVTRLQFEARLTEIGSGKEHDLGRRRRKLERDGAQKRLAAWGSGALEDAARAGADGVLVQLEIKVRRGTLEFGDTVRCVGAVSETGRPLLGARASKKAARGNHR